MAVLKKKSLNSTDSFSEIYRYRSKFNEGFAKNCDLRGPFFAAFKR